MWRALTMYVNRMESRLVVLSDEEMQDLRCTCFYRLPKPACEEKWQCKSEAETFERPVFLVENKI
jgi:hypothetical protein